MSASKAMSNISESIDESISSSEESLNPNERTYDLISSSGSETSRLEEDDEVDLLTRMDREDLFMYIKSDPDYYLSLIKEHNLCSELNILITRNSENILNIKFRIFPEDRWTEVGYFTNASDKEIYRDFITQVNLMLTRTRSYDNLKTNDDHLKSQLEGNNNMQSLGYGVDLPTPKNNRSYSQTPMSIPRDRMTTFERSAHDRMQAQLNQHKKNQMQCGKSTAFLPKKINEHCSTDKPVVQHPPENLKESIQSSKQQLKDKPVDTLNRFVAGILNKIIHDIPNLVQIDATKNYDFSVIGKIKDIDPPENYKSAHKKLISKVKGCQYIQKIHHAVKWSDYPELAEDLLNFHKEALKNNPNLYLNIDEEKLLSLLDDDDKTILAKFKLNIQDLWRDYLLNQD